MYVIEVVPLTKIPIRVSPVLSYFYARDLAAGCLVSINIGHRNENAIVIESHPLKELALDIKKADFELRPVKKIISDRPMLTQNQLKLALWLARYYFAPPGTFLKMMMPRAISNFRARLRMDEVQADGQFLISNKIPKEKFQKLILVPTVAQIGTVAKNYPAKETVIIHSGLKSKQLNENWQKIASGQTRVIIGTRAAAFAPFTNLKEIIVEDETNSGHRSWDMFPHYRTHEVARKLAELFDAKLTLASDLASIESHLINPIGPIGPVRPIIADLIDMRQELRSGNFSIFSQKLLDAIRQALKNKKRIILFINRRGLATSVLCRDCGYVAKCPNCETPLAYHTIKEKEGIGAILLCHRCGYRTISPTACPACKSRRIKTLGTGTERVEIEAEKLFKTATILRLDSDTAKTSEEQEKIVQKFKQKRADILIGTQMLFNLELPKAAVVALISADTLLNLPDFSSDEKIFQTVQKLKFLTANTLFIQTYNPDSKILRLAADGDHKTFNEQQLETRKILKYPPFSQLARLVFRHRDPRYAGTEAKILKAKLTQLLKTSKILNEAVLDISEAVPAFLSKENNKYVWQIVIKFKSYWPASPKSNGGGVALAEEREELLALRNKILMTAPQGWEIEIDPESLL